ncbi:MAG: FkbM family methyltransferase [Candidatus Binatia bacterium]
MIHTTEILRKFAQRVRHAPLLRSLTPLWRVMRRPYLRLINRLGSEHGIVVAVGGIRIRLHPDFATQDWETVEFESYRAFAAMLRPGDVVYDIGGHIGTYTLVALNGIGPSGRVIAYEPHAFTRRYLEQHVRWNGGEDRTLIRRACCGAVRGRAAFYCLPERTEGMSGLVPVEGFSQVLVDVTTLDQEVSILEAIPTVIKIDVEGAEWEVLRGAESTLRKYHPRLALSLHPHALESVGASGGDVLGWLVQLGYGCNVVSEDHEIHVIAAVP